MAYKKLRIFIDPLFFICVINTSPIMKGGTVMDVLKAILIVIGAIVVIVIGGLFLPAIAAVVLGFAVVLLPVIIGIFIGRLSKRNR